MAALKTSEKRLLFVFLGALFLVVNFFLYQEYDARVKRLAGKESQLNVRKYQLEQMRDERAKWVDRRDWVAGRLPRYRTVDDRDTHLVTLVRNAVSAAGLEIAAGPNPLPTEQSEHYEETLVNVTVTGEIEALVRFLHSLQDAEQFRTVTSLQMLPAKKDSSEIRCEITMAQWWSLAGPAVALGEEEAPIPGEEGGAGAGDVPESEAPETVPPASAGQPAVEESGEGQQTGALLDAERETPGGVKTGRERQTVWNQDRDGLV